MIRIITDFNSLEGDFFEIKVGNKKEENNN